VNENPRLALAMMAACNQTILTYGSMALAGALLAESDYTVVYDAGQKAVTKEMQYASALPGWYIMDDEGNLQYEREILKQLYFANA
jgi:hypothetical protein